MRIITKTALATMAVLSVGVAGKSATAMTFAAPAAIGVGTTDTTFVEKAAVVCGYYGCRHVWPHHYYNYYHARHYGWYHGHHYGWYRHW